MFFNGSFQGKGTHPTCGCFSWFNSSIRIALHFSLCDRTSSYLKSNLLPFNIERVLPFSTERSSKLDHFQNTTPTTTDNEAVAYLRIFDHSSASFIHTPHSFLVSFTKIHTHTHTPSNPSPTYIQIPVSVHALRSIFLRNLNRVCI